MIFNPKGGVDNTLRLVNDKDGLTLDVTLECIRVGKYGASRRISFYPSYLIMNLSEIPLQYRQFGSLGSDSQVKVSGSGDMFSYSQSRPQISRSSSVLPGSMILHLPFCHTILFLL